MKEVIGTWGSPHNVLVSVENGYLCLHHFAGQSERAVSFKRKFGKRFGGDAEFWIGIDYYSFYWFLCGCDGLSENDVLEKVGQRKAKRDARKADNEKKAADWEELKKKFDGYVIGIDKSIDVYGSGFSVRVVFSSDVSFREKAKFLRENRVEFVRWVMKEISESKKITNRIGSIKFYKPVEIVNLRAREVEIKFEVKKEDIA